ncbi:hypothetical protein [Pseudanabaena mucicola]|uniref:Secreted protein n=1 Tax=Pseudanabaena mucicola FACHB-723 TaxID=2692860 RepID=A0ABR7ZZ43_9CYAN|nr:hypothetical protein [Pseudanabaena mucicola]MBD2188760.1 hypothetical protein [Pseudanabaena mucicola FACHB-723]
MLKKFFFAMAIAIASCSLVHLHAVAESDDDKQEFPPVNFINSNGTGELTSFITMTVHGISIKSNTPFPVSGDIPNFTPPAPKPSPTTRATSFPTPFATFSPQPN